MKDINGIEPIVGDVIKLTYIGTKNDSTGKGRYGTVTEIGEDYINYTHVSANKNELQKLSSFIRDDVFNFEVLRVF